MVTASTTNSSPDKTDKSNDFDLSKVKVDELPEAIREQIKGFQADYTRKTQALAEEKKEVADKLKRADEWDQWYERNKPTLAQYNEYAQKIARGENIHTDNRKTEPVDDDETDDDPFTDGDKKVDNKINRLRQDFDSGKQEIVTTIQNSNKALLALMEEIQTGEYPFKISPQKVIGYAEKEGVNDMKKAIRGAYEKELVEHEIESRVAARLEEEKAKNVDVVNNTMPQGRVVRKVIKRGEGK